MCLEIEIKATAKWEDKVALARQAVRDYLDSNHGSDIKEYGEASFALGYLGAMAASEAQRLDLQTNETSKRSKYVW